MNTPLRQLPPQLEVVALEDQVVERVGFSPLSSYVETVWLPVLGPTSTLLYRRLGTWVGQQSDLTVDTIDLAVSLGVGQGIARNSPLARAVHRLVQYGAAEWGMEELAVRRALPPLTQRQVGRLSLSATTAHNRMAGGCDGI